MATFRKNKPVEASATHAKINRFNVGPYSRSSQAVLNAISDLASIDREKSDRGVQSLLDVIEVLLAGSPASAVAEDVPGLGIRDALVAVEAHGRA